MNNKVLIVDDDTRILNALSRKLSTKFDLYITKSGKEGLDLLRSNGPWAVIISDYRMPGMNGLEFLGRAKSIAPDAVRVILTGYAELDTAVRAVNENGIFYFLEKPCSVERVREVIAKGIQRFHRTSMQHIKEKYSNKTLTALLAIQAAKDPYTCEHQKNVCQVTKGIASEMNLGNEFVQQLLMAAKAHDIGKSYLPDIILAKSGSLEKYEWDAIKMHPQYGHEIIRKACAHSLPPIMIRQHHERLDGSGYPLGLQDQEINLGAKIIAVADVFDAMSSHRPYRSAMEEEYVIEELKKMRGIHYDCDVVDAFLSWFDRRPAIKAEAGAYHEKKTR